MSGHGEFDIIREFFTRPGYGDNVVLGIGDDAALLAVPPDEVLAVTTDTLVAGRNFPEAAAAFDIGWKSLAVNLSDLAAMGAEPLAFTLALALPPERAQDEAWLAALAQGLFALADAHGCALVGGDTTAGPLNICITVFGEVPAGQALLRSGARAGDELDAVVELSLRRAALWDEVRDRLRRRHAEAASPDSSGRSEEGAPQ